MAFYGAYQLHNAHLDSRARVILYDDLSVETASALATRALCADLEHWATETADLDGRIGVLDLVRVLDAFRAAAPLDVP